MSRGRRALPETLTGCAVLVAAVLPHALGGIVLKGRPGPSRDAVLAELARLSPEGTPFVRMPINVTPDRLLGGLDVGATMAEGRPVFSSGLLEAAHGGFVVISMAERLRPQTAAVIGAALDTGSLTIERDATTRCADARFGVIACDESIDDEAMDCGLAERIGLSISLGPDTSPGFTIGSWSPADVDSARARLSGVELDDDTLCRLVATAAAFAIDSLRTLMIAVRIARASAALRGSARVDDRDERLACELAFPHRANALPETEAPAEPPPETEDDTSESDDTNAQGEMPDDVLVDAVLARLPADLLAALDARARFRGGQSGGGRGGARNVGNQRGRPLAARRGALSGNCRLDILHTLKAAAPWQRLRQSGTRRRPVEIRTDDIHVRRFEERVDATTIFAVDASGSQAAQRLAEVKGAIELLLNDCYVRRDQVALIAFRGSNAEPLLPPTRALARARRSLRGLPGGGGTPLALGLDAARLMAMQERRQGRDTTIVLLTDGRANVTRAGQPDAGEAEREALQAGQALALDGFRCLLVDASRRPRPRARRLADAMRAVYVPLPQASAEAISTAVGAAS